MTKETDLNQAYKDTLARVKKLIAEGHHPEDITIDDPNLMEDIASEVEEFLNVTCAEGL